MRWTLPLLVIITLLASAPHAAGADEGAIRLYDRAQQAYFDLKASVEQSGDPAAWLKIINAYRLIIDSYPNDPLVDDITFITGGIFREMYGQFGDRSYLNDAIVSYRTVLSSYPDSYLQQAALFAIGRIQEEHLRQPDQALLTYQELVRRFPKGYKTSSARQRIAALTKEEEPVSETAETRDRDAAPAAEPSTEENEPPPAPSSLGPAIITDIRTSFGANNGRVVIELDREIKFEYKQLPEPNRRIYFDLHGVDLAKSNLKTTKIDIPNRYLKQIRIGQYSRNVTRVVLDFHGFRRYQVITLPAPSFRIVFDLYGVGRGPGFLSAAKKVPEETGSAGADSNHDGAYSLSRQLGAKIKTVVIDPGHGGRDPGALGLSGLREKDLTLDIAKRVKSIAALELPAINIKLTRDKDSFLPLEQRTALANTLEADLFFSIHANASRRRGRTSGIETYYMNFASDKAAEELAAKENAYSQFNQAKLNEVLKKITLNNKKEESRELAQFVQTNLYRQAKSGNGYARNLGVKSAPFVVLIGADVPSVLVEVAFMDHPVEGKLLLQDGYRDRLARGILEGIKAYVESLQ